MKKQGKNIHTLRRTKYQIIEVSNIQSTDAEISLHALQVKYYNDLLGRQSSERGMDEVTYFYFGELFCVKVYTKKIPNNIEVCNFIPAPFRTLSTKHVIVVFY